MRSAGVASTKLVTVAVFVVTVVRLVRVITHLQRTVVAAEPAVGHAMWSYEAIADVRGEKVTGNTNDANRG